VNTPHPHQPYHRIVPTPVHGARGKTGVLSADFTRTDIIRVLGFEPTERGSYTDEFTASWMFTVDGAPCIIWSYEGRRWAIYDPCRKIPAIFGMRPSGLKGGA
jgi:hypothetical protein